MKQKVEFYKHNISKADKKACMAVLDSLFLTTGKVVYEFEEKFARYLSVKHTIGVTSCTDALFLALKWFDIGAGDEVITTPLTFIASANVIEHCGAKPVFVDVEHETGNINADLIEAAITKKTKAIIAVHLYGHMCDMKKINKIAKKYKLKVIEDAAHCIEGARDGINVGELGDAACFSFYAIKNITSGEGGAISCNDDKAYEWYKMARQHGMSKGAADRYTKRFEHYDMFFLGYKCNMTNIQAALLLRQLENIEVFREKKEEISKLYDEGFYNNPNISMPRILSNTKHARHLYTVWVDPKKRDELLVSLQDEGIGVAVNFRSLHLMKYYRDRYHYKKGMYPVTERIGFSTISLPLYPKLTRKEVDYVIKIVNKLTI